MIYFSTHPRNEDRINILKNLARKDSVIDSPEFNWIKAKYGKNSKINEFNVMEGDLVKKGQVIGKIYKNNSVHFQIRKSRNPVNPNLYIN